VQRSEDFDVLRDSRTLRTPELRIQDSELQHSGSKERFEIRALCGTGFSPSVGLKPDLHWALKLDRRGDVILNRKDCKGSGRV